ncbi:O-antigen ligase family protein [Ruminococcus sp.]|uniref:O-antigen ligase family protein n=1 Tax=Ruminococcus sp. TaxID=41978 RepID=UPI0025EEB325|nr:O-antigen ligase family protein [Ruminococcus sp.]MCR4638914.1 O-antigen ligase family protein [Ruminococcus sp.]
MAKTIFKTTEKSNFILNMTEEQYSKLASRGLIAAMLAVPLFTIIPEITDKASYAFSAGGLAVGGVICMILALIALMKKYIGKGAVIPVCAMGALVGWGVVSLINGYDLNISLYGYPNRGEGLLALMFYFGFFTTAAAIKREKAVETLINGIVGVGALNSLVSLIQIFVKNRHYDLVSMDDKAMAASGLSMSPIFLAMVLTLALSAALIGFVSSENKKRRIIFVCAAMLFSFVIMFTYSIIGICGLVFSVIAAVAAVFALKAPKVRLVSVLASAVGAALAVVLVYAGAVGNITEYRTYDGRIAWWADAYMRASASGSFNAKVVDIDDPVDVYTYMNEKTMNIIGKDPLTGTGPEQLAFPQVHKVGELTEIEDIMTANDGIFDKTYNEYLYTAATRGVPSLIALALALIPALFMGYKALRRRKNAEAFTIFVLTLGGVLMFFISCSSIAYAPVFWAAAGTACAHVETAKEKKSAEKLAKKNEKTKNKA